MTYLDQRTWRTLGLGVAAGYVAFGAFEILLPARAAQEFFAIEPARSPAADDAVGLLTPLLGARDLSIAAALFVLHHTRRDVEMGFVIAAGAILTTADAVVIGRRKGLKSPAFLGVLIGSTAWTTIGLAMIFDREY